MIDTGCDLNLIKENVIKPEMKMNRAIVYDLVGIGPEVVKTIGEIELTIKNKKSSFQVVPHNFPISQNGIIGTSFLRQHQATLNFADITLHLDPENSNNSCSKLRLPARSKVMVNVPIKTTNLKSGYLSKIDAGPGILLGEALVTKQGKFAKCFAINCNNEDIELSLPPVALQNIEDFTIVTPSARTGSHSPHSPEGQKQHASRLSLRSLTYKISMKRKEKVFSLFSVTIHINFIFLETNSVPLQK